MPVRLVRHTGRRLSLGAAILIGTVALVPSTPAPASAQQLVKPAPNRPRGEGEGPFERLIIRGATLIDGTGAPPRGPVDIVVEGNRITRVVDVGFPNTPIDSSRRPKGATKEIDAHGMYVMPGFVDLHLHTGEVPKAPDAEYVYKLWMAHGVTAGRGVPFGPLAWSLSEKARSAKNEITAPRMFVYDVPNDDWLGAGFKSPEEVRTVVRAMKQKGADGLKLSAWPPDLMAAAIDEATKLGMGTTAHLAQLGVPRMNAMDAARIGLGTVTHFYGLFEAMYDSSLVYPYPDTYNYNDEQWRFGQVARQANLVTPRSKKWMALLDTLKAHNVTLDPTMVAYLAGRDVARRRSAEWHDMYTLPSLTDFYTPNRTNHGAYFFNWTTWDEVAWNKFFYTWHMLLNDYKNKGGRVTVSTDAGFIYNTYGFATVEEMEMLQEAGFHPLEVIRAATLHAAETLFLPTGKPIEFGVVRPGMLADIVVAPENPIANLKTLYGTGFVRLNDKTGKVERVGGIKYTIKDGIIYDARKLLADVAAMVDKQKKARGVAQ
jgi:imidazolonepropionase-like amidohydrolase